MEWDQHKAKDKSNLTLIVVKIIFVKVLNFDKDIEAKSRNTEPRMPELFAPKK